MAFVRHTHPDVGTWVEFDCLTCKFDFDFTEPHQPAPAEGSIHFCLQCGAEEVVQIETFTPTLIDFSISVESNVPQQVSVAIEMLGVISQEHARRIAYQQHRCWTCGGDCGQC